MASEYLLDQPLPLARDSANASAQPLYSSGSAATSYLPRQPGDSSLPWFDLSLDRDRAQSLLMGRPPGSFVVRASSRPDCYALSFTQPDPNNPRQIVVNHLLIRKLTGPPVRFCMDLGTEDKTNAAPKYATLQQLLCSLDYLDQKQVRPLPTFFEESWYWGDLTPAEATQTVLTQSQGRPGVFLGRYCSRGFAITVSVSPSEVAHVYFIDPPPPNYAKLPKRKASLAQLRLGQLPPSEPSWKSFCTTISISNPGAATWQEEFAKYSSKFAIPINRPAELNPTPMKLLWACSHGLIELAYQLIMRDGTSRTTKTKTGWTPLNEALRAILSIVTPFATEKSPAAPEMHKLLEISRMIASDARIDVSLRGLDETRRFFSEHDWDDVFEGVSPMMLTLQSYSHYNHDIFTQLVARNVRPDAASFIAMAKNRFFRMYREYITKTPVDTLKPAANRLLFTLLDTLSYASPTTPAVKRLDHHVVPEDCLLDPDIVYHCVETLGADMNAVMKVDFDGKGDQEVTPVVLAARGGSVVILAYFVERGVDLSKTIAAPPALSAAGAGSSSKITVLDAADLSIRHPISGALLDHSYETMAEYIKMLRKRFHIK